MVIKTKIVPFCILNAEAWPDENDVGAEIPIGKIGRCVFNQVSVLPSHAGEKSQACIPEPQGQRLKFGTQGDQFEL